MSETSPLLANATKPLNVAILGTGNIGSTVASQLSQAGHDVTAIARPNSTRLAQLTLSKAIITTSGSTAPITPASSLDPEVPYDLLIITLSAHQVTPRILSSISSSAVRSVLCLFNTFTPEDIQSALPKKSVEFGLPFFQALLDDSGHLEANITGSGTQPTLVSSQNLVDIFQSAGLPAAFEQDMQLWLRCHAPMCVALEAVSILGQRRGGGASWRESMTTARGVAACWGLIRAQGYVPYPGMKRGLERCPAWLVAFFLWAMSRVTALRELLAHAGAECDAMTDVLVAAGKTYEGVNVEAIERMKPEEV